MVHTVCSTDIYTNNDGIFRLISEICKLARVNIAFFRAAQSWSLGRKIRDSLEKLSQHLESASPSVKRIAAIAPKYDFEPSIQGNGYHSLLTIFRKCCLKILEIIRDITLYKESWLFNTFENYATLEEFVIAVGQLRACFHYMERLNEFCSEESLFPDDKSLTEDEESSAIALMYEFETLNPECFYGRCLGFQYASSMQRPLTVINQALACHSRVFSKSNRMVKIALGILSANTYFRNVEERAKQIATVTRECEVDFCQSFWSISDNPTLVQLSLLACPRVAVDSVLDIPFDEVQLPSIRTSAAVTVKMLNPEHYKNPRMNCDIKYSVSARLLSAKLRMGQETFCSKLSCLYRSWKGQKEKRSPFLIIHLHGGGFVGQSSASHEVYLRDWAVESDSPILSVDYSHAPQFRAPYQLEEAFFAYCWALKNASLLGSTAERVVVVGDSAGGNLAVGVGLVAAQRGVRRPDAVYPIYGSMVVQYKPGPSRLLAIMDPLIPLGIVSVCLQAYLGTTDCNQQEVKFDNSSSEEEDIDDSPIKSMGMTSPAHTRPPSSSSISTSPSLAAAVASGLVKPQADFVPRILSPPSLVLHNRNDSGFFDSSLSDEKRRPVDLRLGREESLGIGRAVCEDYVRRRMPASAAEEGEVSEESCGNSSASFERKPGSGISAVVASYAQLKTYKVSPMARSLKNNPGDSPFISPVLAPDTLLKTLNRVHITACHLDPLLDDSISLARRLRDVGVDVDLDLISDLPHGFLNFVTVSAEAHCASRKCLRNVVSLLEGIPSAR